jgi:GT2 family glycosyltransferase
MMITRRRYMSEPVVSVIVPVRDGAKFIGEALDSVLAQTFRQLEVIVVDDGSRDTTPRVVEARLAHDPRLRLIRQANRGVAAARNRALADARGEFVAPLDADDLWDPTKIERQVARIREAGDRTALVYCWWVSIDGDGQVLDCSPRWTLEGDASDALLEVNFTGNASVPLYRRQLLEQIGGYDESLRARHAEGCEDWDVALKVAEEAKVAVVRAPLVAYRRCRESMSSQRDRMWHSHALVLESAESRRGPVPPQSIRLSQDHIALHFAAGSFWSGAYGEVLRWTCRAWRSGLTLRLLPYAVGALIRRPFALRRRGGSAIAPGVAFSEWDGLRSLIPYDRLYPRTGVQHSAHETSQIP